MRFHQIPRTTFQCLRQRIHRLQGKDKKHSRICRESRKLTNLVTQAEKNKVHDDFVCRRKQGTHFTRQLHEDEKWQKIWDEEEEKYNYYQNILQTQQHYQKLHSVFRAQHKNRSNSRINSIVYFKTTDWDCKSLTRCTRQQLQQLSRLCRQRPEQLFHFWVRINRYLPWDVQCVITGIPASTLRRNFKVTLDALYNSWGTQQTVCDAYSSKWTRRHLYAHTTNVAKKVWNLGMERLAVIMDGTYQYVQHVQTENTLFKKMLNAQKKRSLLKPHIVIAPDAQIIHCSKMHASDGHHNDSGIYKFLFKM